ncbi:MAG: organomercurial transporter MerC [Methyloprofundus sp.]|nr:organomercurial transporter MerC [Methyloprofundus sp.]
MEMLVRLLTRFGDKIGSLGALVSAMGCAMCFPAIASLGAAVGLGFLSQWEGLFVNTLLPLFAWIALILNGLGWFSHRQWHRSVLGMTGPILLLLSLYPWFQYSWSTYVTYSALGLMVAVSLWDIFSPANKRCDDERCAV